MKKLIISFLFLCMLNCSNNQNKLITNDEAIIVLKGFFDAMDIDNLGKGLVYNFTTDDFVIFEMGQKFELKPFMDFIKTEFKSKNYISTDWELYDFKVSSFSNSAHISYFNKGVFVYIEDGIKKQMNTQWLESVLLVKDDGVLKLTFLQSDDIKREIIELKDD